MKYNPLRIVKLMHVSSIKSSAHSIRFLPGRLGIPDCYGFPCQCLVTNFLTTFRILNIWYMTVIEEVGREIDMSI